MSDKKIKSEKMELKLRKIHPRKSFRLGRHVILPAFKEFEMNEEEMKELKNAGCKAWIISKKEFEENKKAKAKKKS